MNVCTALLNSCSRHGQLNWNPLIATFIPYCRCVKGKRLYGRTDWNGMSMVFPSALQDQFWQIAPGSNPGVVKMKQKGGHPFLWRRFILTMSTSCFPAKMSSTTRVLQSAPAPLHTLQWALKPSSILIVKSWMLPHSIVTSLCLTILPSKSLRSVDRC